MQYFQALKMGQKRVEASRAYLNSISNDRAMPALALRDNKTNVWEPVGEENLYAVVDESSGFVLTDSSGYIIAICDSKGTSKSLVQSLNQEQKDNIVELLKKDNIVEYKGKVAFTCVDFINAINYHTKMNKYSKIIEVRGHLIDSLVLTKIFDRVMDLEGKFEVMKISVGKLKTDESYAKLKVIGKNNSHLNEIMTALHREGATTKTQKGCKTKAATKNMVFPDNFYSTTNNHTSIYHNKKWINVDNMMMDKCIIVKGNKAACVPIRDVRKGDKVIVGEDGIRVSTPERPREGMNVFNSWEVVVLVKGQLNTLHVRLQKILSEQKNKVEKLC